MVSGIASAQDGLSQAAQRQRLRGEYCPPVGPDRFALMMGGAALAICGITRGTLPGLVAAAIGGYAAYRAAGMCNPDLAQVNRTFGGPDLPRPALHDATDERLFDTFPASDPASY